MKEIELTQGKVALVDDEDCERLSQHKWCAGRHRQAWYAERTDYSKGKRKIILMHRELMNAPKGMQVDHRNGDGLFNCKENLRLATNQQNHFNKRKSNKNNKLGIKGVSWHESKKKFRARIKVNGKAIHIGSFKTLDEADIAYRRAELIYFGEFARESSKLYVKVLNSEYQMSLAG